MLHRKIGLIALCLIAALAVACGGGGEEAPPAPKPAATTGSATIQGTVSYANGDPDEEINMAADPVCLELHEEPVHTEQVVAGAGGGLANVFVYVKSGLTGSYPVPDQTPVLDQVGCQYRPHVSGIQVGQTLVIRNSDETLHNVHALPKINEEFNQGQPFHGMELEKKFTKPEVMIRFKCDVHPWMSSYLGVLEHPFYAVTDASGGFSIDSLPAGTYTLEAWHEKLGTQTQEVTVADGGTAEANWQFGGAAASGM